MNPSSSTRTALPPASDASLAGEKTPFLSVVIPAYNEELKIQADLEKAISYLESKSYPYEIIVVDDGSRDQTALRIREFQQKNRSVRQTGYSKNQGKGFALKTGILQATGEHILFADAGGCVPYEDMEQGLALLKQGWDIAIGSRGLEHSKILIRQPLYRRLGSKAFGMVVHSLLGIRGIRDTQCGFKLFKRPVAHRLFQMQRVRDFMFDVEMTLNAQNLGYRIKEFPVRWSNDPDSRFKPLTGTLRQTVQVLKIAWHCRFKRILQPRPVRDFSCNLCGCAGAKNWRIVDGYPVVRCRKCGLASVHPQPTDLERENQYQENRTAPAYDVATARLDGSTFHHRMHMIEKFLPKGRMLDVGCNVGTLMEAAAERGWQATGMEPNSVAVQQAKERGLNVVQGFLTAEQADALQNFFDLVNMFDVIEHFNDPAEAVRLTRRMLKSGGFFSLSTPNLRSWVARRFQIKPLEHLFYFDAGTLTLLLERNGFNVEWIKKTTRRLDFKNTLLSHTHLRPTLRLCVRAIIALRLAELLSWIWTQAVRDELWVLARKEG